MPFAFKLSGELIPPTAEELAEADKDSAILCYTDGMMEDGRPYYAYIAVRPSRYQEFKAITDAGEGLTLGEYGEVIAADFLPKPPHHVVKEMQEKYGFDEHFKDKLVAQIRQEQAAFLEQQEKKRLDGIVEMLKKQQATADKPA